MKMSPRARKLFDKDLGALIKYKIIDVLPNNKIVLNKNYLCKREAVLIKLSDAVDKFNLNTFDGFKKWFAAANDLTILHFIKKSVREDVLFRYLDIVEILDKAVMKAAKSQVYNRKKVV
jgi:hypothetical protein